MGTTYVRSKDVTAFPTRHALVRAQICIPDIGDIYCNQDQDQEQDHLMGSRELVPGREGPEID